ncbi:hypothetical protein J1N35_020504 [Gossypium stocksii]|uniref:Uncharacterized protein n=1 Tax=Gossypium stocksii TaxID=47602 RepID=A0A9D3VCR3_9ROSI|nr:hypothetical protein J1N35_020504 [Gossypium stocksii]
MEIEDKRILFRFYSEIDLKRVMNENDRWASIKVDEESKARRFSADVTNKSDHKGGMGSVGHFVQHIMKAIDLGTEDNIGQFKERGIGSELEDMPVEFVDGKKRQRFNLEVRDYDNNRGLLELELENAISAAATK